MKTWQQQCLYEKLELISPCRSGARFRFRQLWGGLAALRPWGTVAKAGDRPTLVRELTNRQGHTSWHINTPRGDRPLTFDQAQDVLRWLECRHYRNPDLFQ